MSSIKQTPRGVSIENASYTVNGKSILSNINLCTDAARIGIVGRNGSGKSTLARLICGLIEPSAGSVTVSGVNVFKDRAAALRTVGILFQNPDHQILFPTVLEEISFGLAQLGMTQATAEIEALSVLSLFGKSHWSGAAVHQLSQGQKQLVCLMAVFAMQPKLIILDEPLSGLDLPTTKQITRYFDACNSALVHISHRSDVLQHYDTVYWIENGCIELSGDASIVLAQYEQRMNEYGESDDIAQLST